MESLSETQNRTYREMCKGIQHSRGEYHQSLSKEQKEKIAKHRKKREKHPKHAKEHKKNKEQGHNED